MPKKWKILSLVLTLIISLSLITPTFASTLPPTTQLAGLTKYDTAVAIAKAGWPQSDYAILAYGENYPDALAAAPLAQKYNAPILLTESASLTDVTKQALLDLKVKSVYIVGGTAVISSQIKSELDAMGIGGSRYAGYDLYDTAASIAQGLNVAKNTPVVIASGEQFPDALSISSIASSKGWPILLAGKNYLAQSIKDYVTNQQPSQIYIVGGTAVISEDIKSQVQALAPNALITRLAGLDLFDTNALVNQTFAQNPQNIYLATGFGFADALAGSELAARTGDPIVLVDPKSYTLPPNTNIYLSTIANLNKTVPVTSFGGSAVVPPSLMNSANSILNHAYGNTSGNYTNSALAAFDGQFIYFSNENDGYKIYRIKPDGSGMSKVSSNSSFSINVVGDWVYYTAFGIGDQGIYKVKKDGSGQTKISTEFSFFINVTDDWIYYYANIPDTGVSDLYKMKTDGSNKIKIPLNSNLVIVDGIQPVVTLGDWIYINVINTSDHQAQLYKMKNDGTSAEKIVGSQVIYFVIDGDWIYYIDNSAYDEIRKVKIDGTSMSTLYKASTSGTILNSLNVSGNQIFFCVDNQTIDNQTTHDAGIYRMNLDGSSLTKLTDTWAWYLNIVSDWIYFEGPSQLMKIKTDGSQESLVS